MSNQAGLAKSSQHSQPAWRGSPWRRFYHRIEPALYIGPAFLVLAVILVYPLGYSFWLSFHEWTLRGFRKGVPFVGLENYLELLANPEFINSLRITFTFVLWLSPLNSFWAWGWRCC
jgi:ABC-type sugar transport system permease subunit